MKATKNQIENFLKSKKLAIAGVSSNEKKFGYHIFTTLQNKDYDVIPINPNAEEINGTKCYSNISQLPEKIDSLLIATPKSQTDAILKDAIALGIKNIWIQQKCESADTLKIAKDSNIDIISNQCIFMFANPKGIHKFHKVINKIFGKLPK